MSANVTTYEVRVKVRSNKPVGYLNIRGCYHYDEVIKMFHKIARTPHQALNKCKKYGIPISVKKVDVQIMHKNFEELPLLNKVYMEDTQYKNAMAMDEMIWEKRNKRIDNKYKDKITIENTD
jgi:hypothetical protein